MAATLQNKVTTVRAVHAGATVATGEYTLTATLSLDSVVQLIPIPHGATLIDVYARLTTTAGNMEMTIEDNNGVQFSATLSMSGSLIMRATKNLPKTYSLTDGATDRFVWLNVGAGSAAAALLTVGEKVTLCATYIANDRTGGGGQGGVS